MKKFTRLLLVGSGVLPILLIGTNAYLLIYTLFVLALLLRSWLVPLVQRIPLRPWIIFVGLVIGSGWVEECLAWTTNYLARNKKPALLHPQLIPDLILALGFYGGWALAWLLVLRRWRFSLPHVFVTTGILGIFFEQNGVVFLSLLGNPLLGLLLVLLTFPAYGAIMGLPYLLAEKLLARPEQREGWLKYPVVLLLMVAGAVILTFVIGLIALALHVIPPRRPIWEHPFF